MNIKWQVIDDSQIEINPKILEYIKKNNLESPCLLLDLEKVEENYDKIKSLLPYINFHYAVKSNPSPKIVSLLNSKGSCFDAASIAEIKLCFDSGAKPEQILFGHTIKKEQDIVDAYNLGIRHYVFDNINELEKLSKLAPEAKVICRIKTTGEGAACPLSKKFGCSPEMAVKLMKKAVELNLKPYGISFHVGSQQLNPLSYENSIRQVGNIFKDLEEENILLSAVNIGGGFAVPYKIMPPKLEEYSKTITEAFKKYFTDYTKLHIIAEPGRYLAAEAGIIQTEIVSTSLAEGAEGEHWLYLDIGKYNGLWETHEIEYLIAHPESDANLVKTVFAGPTCESGDLAYEKASYFLPSSLKSKDKILFLNIGAYSAIQSTVGFNGFKPLTVYYVN